MLKNLLAALILVTLPTAGPPFLYENPAADRDIRHAMTATYNLDLVEARKTARSMQKTFPDHPVGFLLDAETYWWEAQIDPTREDLEEVYFDLQEKTVEVGEKALKSTKYPALEIRAHLASAWGSKARFRLTQHGIGLKTVLDGNSANGYAQEVFKADPNYIDILAGIGAYNYFTGKIPGILKPFAFLFGANGDPVLGLRQIHTAIEKGRYAQTEARIVLFTALMKDGQYDKSFQVVQQMMAAYPSNHALYSWVTEWYRDQNKNLEGAAYFEKLHAEKLPTSRKLAQYALYEKAVLQHAHRRTADARSTIARLRGIGTPDPALSRTLRRFEEG